MSRTTKTPFMSFCRYAVMRPAVGLALGVLLLFAGRGEVQAVELNILAAGATESIIRDMVGTFEKESGHTVKLTYAPVGALRDKIYAGEPADLTIVTPVIIEQLQAKGLVRAQHDRSPGKGWRRHRGTEGRPPPRHRNTRGAETGALVCN